MKRQFYAAMGLGPHFVVSGHSREILENNVLPIIQNFLSIRGLTLSEEKTKITHIDKGFDFLGQNVRKYNGTLLIKPSKANVKIFLRKVRALIKSQQAAELGNLIDKLNPIVRGWCNYHRHIVAKNTFKYVDHSLFKCLWKWAVRRHPKKSKSWVKQRYFRRNKSRDWTFSDCRNVGTEREVFNDLYLASSTPIRRHIKIRGNAVPFHPAHQDYLDVRFKRKSGSGRTGLEKA